MNTNRRQLQYSKEIEIHYIAKRPAYPIIDFIKTTKKNNQ